MMHKYPVSRTRLTFKRELAGPVENGLKREKGAKEIDSKEKKVHCRSNFIIARERRIAS